MKTHKLVRFDNGKWGVKVCTFPFPSKTYLDLRGDYSWTPESIHFHDCMGTEEAARKRFEDKAPKRLKAPSYKVIEDYSIINRLRNIIHKKEIQELEDEEIGTEMINRMMR